MSARQASGIDGAQLLHRRSNRAGALRQGDTNRWPERPAINSLHIIVKSITKTLFVIGALLFVALLLISNLATNPLLTSLGRNGLFFGLAVAMAGLGVAMFPRTRNKRLVVKREVMLGSSLLLFVGAGLLLSNMVSIQSLLAALFGHPLGLGCSMAAASVVFTEDQALEFRNILGEIRTRIPDRAVERLDALSSGYADLQREVKRLRQQSLNGGNSGVRWVGNKPFVTDDCASALTSIFVVGCSRIDGALATLVPDSGARERVISQARANLGIEMRTAMSGTEIPLPTVYAPQVVELVFKYGMARQHASVLPLGAGTVKWPRLKAGEDDFTYYGAGTAGLSQPITEKRVAAEQVTFTANKAGGIIRLPTELEEDTFIPIGQFLARYIARQFAKLEDKTLFLADGTSTYASQTGVGPYCAANPTYLLQLAGTKTKPSDATLADFRNLRSKVSAALLSGGFDAAYYMSPTFEPSLRAFNSYPNFVVFTNDNGKPMFDGWPVRWVGVTQPYLTSAAASSYIAFFGDLSYWYLGERGVPRIEVSRDVYFSTDELAMRALERIDVEAMGIDAMAALQTAGT
jgi:HK97 family phage major capsid protein